MNGQTEKNNHSISLNMRKEMRISGVKEVNSFDENGVTLHTDCGMMNVEGSGIRVDVLDLDRGLVTLNGQIDSIFYMNDESKGKHGFLERLLR